MFVSREDHPARVPPPLEVLPDRWYAVLLSKDLRDKPVSIRRFGEDLVLYRASSGAIHCFVDRCPHRGVKLSLGRVSGDELVCGYHAFRFRGDGSCSEMPCEGPDARIPKAMRAIAFSVQEAHGIVWVFWGAPRQEVPAIPWIPDLPSETSYASDLAVEWPVPAFRAIQANFDSHHAAFLHGPRSVRFTPTRKLVRADEVHCEANEEGIEFHVVMRDVDPKGPKLHVHTSFRFPGVSYVRLGSFGLLGILDTPLDAATTFRVIRHVSPFGRAGGLGKLYAKVSLVLDYYLGSQRMEDLPFVRTQASPGELFSDIFIGADTGIAHYERLRLKHLRAARAEADRYPPHVRLRLGPSKGERVRLPVIGADLGAS